MFNINVFDLSKRQLIKHQLLVKLGAATKLFFNDLFFNVKTYHLLGPILGKYVDVHKHCKNRSFNTSLSNKGKTYHFEGLLSGPSRDDYLGEPLLSECF